jgi:type VI secretion system protein ImpM
LLPGFTAAGFCGKIPARGDFVRAGMPRSFTDPWDDWIQRVLAASRATLGKAWLPAWLEAPIWRFALRSGVCGPDAMLGLWLPSVDRIGRHYPLTFAIAAADADPARLIAEGGGFLAAAERAGCDALANDLPPEALAERIAAAVLTEPDDPRIDPWRQPPAPGIWWTDGGPRVPPKAFATAELPDAATFAAMLDTATPVVP